jgi:K+-transporting ATPase ATPase A chain
MTTATGCGAVNSMHDSFTPIGGLVTLANILTGQVVFGGVGSGLYAMIVFVVVAMFIAGLMIGRTPDYLGKSIGAREVKLSALVLLVAGALTTVMTAWACVTGWGTAGLNNGGPHGLTEMLYAFASGTGNNGSGFAGLTMTPTNGNVMWNLTQGIAILFGRLLPEIAVMALAGAFVAKKRAPDNPARSFPVSGPTFVLLLTSTVIVVGALSFLPALALGPLAEHFSMTKSAATF